MRLIKATAEFVVEGRSFEGFPLLLGKDGWPVEPAHEFLWETLVGAGGADSKLTWEAYGRRLFDFFAFLEANRLSWDQLTAPLGTSVVAKYRDWSLNDCGLSASTVNKRLGLVARLYQWSKRRGYIEHLPFTMRQIARRPHGGFLAHVGSSAGTGSKPSVMVREHKPVPKLLVKEQARVCLSAKLDPSHRVLLDLMLRAGLRSCEARTFPLKYVFNPRSKPGLSPGNMVRVSLDPADMHIKLDKPRSVDVPWSLMEDLWSYSLHERSKRSSMSSNPQAALALTRCGTEFSKSAVVDAMKSIERKVGFHVRAHMLRHTYGTFTLSALRKNPSFAGEPLLYVRDRMGHSDVQTTSIYLHLINQLDAQAVFAHEDEINALFGDEIEERHSGGS